MRGRSDEPRREGRRRGRHDDRGGSRPSVAKTEMAASFITEATFSRTSGEKNRSVAELIASPTAVSILPRSCSGPPDRPPIFAQSR